MNATYELLQYNNRQRLKKRHPAQSSHSFVKAFLQLLYVSMSDAASENIIDITNTSRNFDSYTDARTTVVSPGLDSWHNHLITGSSYSATHAIGVRPFDITADECGIIVGTSSTAVAVADDNLVSPIAHGASAGQFIYYGCYGLNYSTGASSASFDIERIFRNDSGGGITVAEIGMYAATSMTTNTDTSARSFCILRDVLGATVTVNNGEYLKVKYTITVSN